MKHFRTLLIAAFCTFFTTVYTQNIQRDQVIEFDVDTYFGDIAPADDAGLFFAGYMGHSDGAQGDQAFVQQFNAQHELVWTCNFDSVDVLAPYQSIVGVDILPLENGSVILLISRLECDLLIHDFMAGISPDGVVLWHKVTNHIGGKMVNWGKNYFAIYDDVCGFKAYSADGEEALFPTKGQLPAFVVPLPDGQSVEANYSYVWIDDSFGQQVDYWTSPYPVNQLDTLPNGAGYVVYCDHQMYLLSPSLDSAFEIIKEDLWKYNVHPINGGYLALEHSGSQSYLHRWNENLETVSSLQLRQDLDIYPWIHALNYFFVRDDHFNLAASLLPLHQGNAVWLISSPIAASGDWQTATDLVVTDITFSGIPTGEITGVFPAVPPANQYNVDYTNVSVEVKNTGTDTIQHFFINFRADACEPTTCYHPEWIWRKSYDSTGIAPGETRKLAFDSIHISCTTLDIKRFCVWVSDVNHQSDNSHYDNLGCVDLPGIVSTDAVPAGLPFSIAPNPVQDVLTIQLPDERRIKSVRLFSPDRRSVREVSGNSTTIFMGDLPSGIYMIEVISESGARGWRRVVR